MRTKQEFIDAEKKYNVSRKDTIEIIKDKIKVAKKDRIVRTLSINGIKHEIIELKLQREELIEQRESYNRLIITLLETMRELDKMG